MTKTGEKLFFSFLLITAVILLHTRFTYRHIPLERDEGEYAYAGSLLLHGHHPYHEAYNMKFPGAYFMYALIMKTGGESIEAIRIGLCFIILLTAFLTGTITYHLTGNMNAGALAGVTFIALTNTMGGEGLMANAEHFVNLFAVSGILVLLVFLDRSGSISLVFLSGVLLSLAVIMKQYGYPFCLFAISLLFARLYRKPGYALTKAVVVFITGCTLPVLLLTIWILKNDLWTKFRFLTIDYAYAYIRSGSGNLGKSLTGITSGSVALYALVAASLLIVLSQFRQRYAAILVLWVIFSILAFSTGFYLRPHYFLLVYPAFGAVTGYAYYVASGKIGFGMAKVIVAFLLLLFFVTGRQEQFPSDPQTVFNQHYQWGMFGDMPKISQRVREFIPDSDKLSLFASEPEIYFYSRHIAASGYIYNYSFFEEQPYAYQMMNEFIKEVEANPSRLFVFYTGSLTRNGSPYNALMRWWDRYSQNFNLKDVYVPTSADKGVFLGEEKIRTDSSWKNEGMRAEFWMRKN